ncbi:MAG TPA: methyltransferase domain-containing protein [Candidatus Binatia bacterium]|nr:methyltransferase domain-containing protein [Candidatus Binatia bacterium]
MTTKADISVADRLVEVLDHLGIERAHFAASMLADVTGLVQAHPERIASLTLICPPRVDPSALRALGTRLQIVTGDQGRPSAMVRDAATNLPEAAVVWLPGYFSPPWADVVADHTAEIESALLNVVFREPQNERVASGGPQGTVAGISYYSEGEGTPLVLLPLSLASSQWEPLLPRLTTHCRTVTLGGPELGFLAMLESRGASAGYLSVVRRLMDAVELRPGEVILEVGCGSGVLDRWLARYTMQANRIIGVDVNRYLLREATALAMQEGLADVIAFQEGDAESLPFPDNLVDVAVSFTVLEEGNADRMLSELVRVVKPGGRVAVMVRALDIPWVVNVPLRPELKTKVETPRGFVGAEGCADASLYRRFQQAGLAQVKMFPQFAASDQPETPQAQFAHGAILRCPHGRGNSGVVRGYGASRGGQNLFYCPAISLRRGNKARDSGIIV